MKPGLRVTRSLHAQSSSLNRAPGGHFSTLLFCKYFLLSPLMAVYRQTNSVVAERNYVFILF